MSKGHSGRPTELTQYLAVWGIGIGLDTNPSYPDKRQMVGPLVNDRRIADFTGIALHLKPQSDPTVLCKV